MLSESMIISYIEDKKKKRTRVANWSAGQNNEQRRYSREKDDIELREVREWCCVEGRDFFCSDPGFVWVSTGVARGEKSRQCTWQDP
jgi:hypothetical protein